MLREKSLHASVKLWYARPQDRVETPVDGYVVDIVRDDDLLVEIQTRSFAPLKKKLRELTKTRHVRLVHPIATEKWILRISEHGEELGRRKSPKRGRVEDVFRELVSIPDLLQHERFVLEVLLIQEEEVRMYDGKGSWRHPEWHQVDRRLLEVVQQLRLRSPQEAVALLPDASALPRPFTNRQLATAAKMNLNLAGRMTYCLRAMDALEVVGTGAHRAQLFAEPGS
ncbi:MAG: hypothetical protein O2782_22970 [bacterium]|nr:hypothetical protein [bacterium]